MIKLFELIIINLFVVMALKVAMSEGMIFERVGNFFESKVEEGKWYYDAFICPWCMGTLQSFTSHGVAIGLGLIEFEFSVLFFIRWVLLIFASSFINGFIWNIYITMNAKKEYYQSETSVNVHREKYYEHAEKEKFYTVKKMKQDHFDKLNQNNNGNN